MTEIILQTFAGKIYFPFEVLSGDAGHPAIDERYTNALASDPPTPEGIYPVLQS